MRHICLYMITFLFPDIPLHRYNAKHCNDKPIVMMRCSSWTELSLSIQIRIQYFAFIPPLLPALYKYILKLKQIFFWGVRGGVRKRPEFLRFFFFASFAKQGLFKLCWIYQDHSSIFQTAPFFIKFENFMDNLGQNWPHKNGISFS